MFADLQLTLWRALEPAARPKGLSPVNRAIVALILFSAGLAVLETEPVIMDAWAKEIVWAELAIAAIFSLEYLGRLFAAGRDSRYVGLRGRLRWMATPSAILDLLAILPSLILVGGDSGFLLRFLRLLRILRIARLGRFGMAFDQIWDVVRQRTPELLASLLFAMVLLLLSASALYLAEGGVQPEAFGSIPRALWWAVATLTTVGYGDVYPITPLGRFLAAVTAIAGIGLIAMPAGILAASFAEALARGRRRRGDGAD
jgi:voltage-gated potassium channel